MGHTGIVGRPNNEAGECDAMKRLPNYIVSERAVASCNYAALGDNGAEV